MMTFRFGATYLMLWALVVCLTLVALELLRQLQVLKNVVATAGFSDAAGLTAGSSAPSFAANDLRTQLLWDSSTMDGSTRIIVFLSPSCSVCKRLAASLSGDAGSRMPLVAICQGSDTECQSLLERLPSDVPFLSDPSGNIGRRYGVLGPPTAVVVDNHGIVRGTGHPKDAIDMGLLVAMALREQPKVIPV